MLKLNYICLVPLILKFSIHILIKFIFSGMVVHDTKKSSRIPEVVAKSGKALVYFYSDAAYNLTGFSISYK